jgi:hypothetical protein
MVQVRFIARWTSQQRGDLISLVPQRIDKPFSNIRFEHGHAFLSSVRAQCVPGSNGTGAASRVVRRREYCHQHRGGFHHRPRATLTLCTDGRMGRMPNPTSEAPAMKRFFYASAAILMLSLAFHFGYTTARAQAPGNPVVAGFLAQQSQTAALTANGDVYLATNPYNLGLPWQRVTNIFEGIPTPALHESWGQLKSRYAPQSAPVLQAPTNK